jgi:homogentisate 1,2-dioxygenase
MFLYSSRLRSTQCLGKPVAVHCHVLCSALLDDCSESVRNHSAMAKEGYAIHTYAINVSMGDCALANADGDLLIVPQLGTW